MLAVNSLQLLLIAVAIVLPLVATWGWLGVNRQRSWVTVSGRVVRSRVESQGEDYKADVEYAYGYQEHDYRGTRVRSFQLRYNWPQPAERVCQRYLEGAVVEVFVNPRDPTQSVLEPGGGGWLVPTAAVLSVCLVVMAFVMGR
jgi:hypothetical protein